MQKKLICRHLSIGKLLMPRDGFTLMELLVAMAAASVLSLSALKLYGQFHGMVLLFVKDYQQESTELLLQMRNVFPYKGKIPGSKTRD